jgi:PAS domain S-box-containing protein
VGTTVELTALHRRGYEIPVELAIWAFGESTGWTFNGLIRDISGRKESEERLRASERRLADAQQVAGVGSWEWQLVTDTVVWSDELYRLYGLTPESFETYQTFLDLVDERDRLRVAETLVASKASGKPFEFDHRITRPDGRLRVLHAKGEVLFDNGQAIRMRGTARDVTERRHSEEELRRLRAALESAVKGMAQVNRQGRYTSVNDGYAAMCGRHPEEMTGLPWMDVVHAADREKASAGYRAMLNDDRAVFEVAGARPDGSFFEQRMVLVSTYDGDGEFIGHVCCMQDITARRQAETEQRAMVEQLTQLDREKTDLISCVSHELRTPLTSMLGFLELLTGGEVGTLNPDQSQMMEVVDRNARRLLSRVDDLLTVSRNEAGAFPLTLGPVALDVLAKVATDSMAPALALRQLELVVEVADGAGTITGDVDQLDRVLLNLLSNAVKFTPDGGRISLRVWREEASVVIVVADNGMGVPEEEQPRLFQRFFRSSAATEMAIPGTGLGLVIIRSIVEQHHGQIRLRSSPGVGTEVTITLPVDLSTVAPGSQDRWPSAL